MTRAGGAAEFLAAWLVAVVTLSGCSVSPVLEPELDENGCVTGFVIITSQDLLDQLAQYSCFDSARIRMSHFEIEDESFVKFLVAAEELSLWGTSGLAMLEMANLERVGSLSLDEIVGLEAATFPALRSMKSLLTVSWNEHLLEISFPQLRVVEGSIQFRDNLSLEKISFPQLERACESAGPFGFSFIYNPALKVLEFPQLERIGAHAEIRRNNNLRVLDLSSVRYFDSRASIGLTNPVDVRFTALEGLPSSFYFGALDSRNLLDYNSIFPNLTWANHLTLGFWRPHTQLTIDTLEYVDTLILKSTAQTISLPALTVAQNIILASTSWVEHLDFPALCRLGNLSFDWASANCLERHEVQRLKAQIRDCDGSYENWNYSYNQNRDEEDCTFESMLEGMGFARD